jgi:hypothetical protein
MPPRGHFHGQIPVVVTVEADQGVDQGVGHLSTQEVLMDQDGHQWDQVEEADQEDLEAQEAQEDQEDLAVQADQATQEEAEGDQAGDHSRDGSHHLVGIHLEV